MNEIRKVKFDPKKGEVTIHVGEVGVDWDKKEAVVSTQPPHPDFLHALRELRVPALEFLEIDPEHWMDGLTGRGMTQSVDGKGIVRTTVTLMKTLENGQVVSVNTPSTPVEELPEGLAEAVERLGLEALQYYEGKRAQGDLFAFEQEEVRRALEEDGGHLVFHVNVDDRRVELET